MSKARRPVLRRAHLLAASTACAMAVLVLGAPSASALSAPPLSVRAATLIVGNASRPANTGRQLFGVSPNTQLAIASTTKLMTALVTLEHASMSQTFTYPTYYLSPQDSQIGLVPGERMSVQDLFVAMMLPSADDAAYDLAYNIGHGSVGRFIAIMNRDARKLDLHHTHYSTPIGFDSPGNYSSANDLVNLASYLLQHYKLFAHVVGMSSAVLHTGNHVRNVVNLNDLVARFPWIHGVKTGHTLAAGYVLVAAGTQNGMSLLSAVLGTASDAARDANTLALLNWGFANFRLAKPVDAGDVLARPTVAYRPGVRANVIAARSFAEVIPRGHRLHLDLVLPHELTGPIKSHAVVGTAIVLDDKRHVARISLLLAHALAAVSPLAIAARFITRPSTLSLLLLVMLLGGTAVFIVRRRGQRRASPRTA